MDLIQYILKVFYLTSFVLVIFHTECKNYFILYSVYIIAILIGIYQFGSMIVLTLAFDMLIYRTLQKR